MTPEIISVLTAFAPVFTRPTWKNINTLLIGAILCRGARRITSILRVMGLSEVKNFSKISSCVKSHTVEQFSCQQDFIWALNQAVARSMAKDCCC